MGNVYKENPNPLFGKFIDVMEIAYAVLMSWGFARVAIGWKTQPEYVLASLIALLVLIRFFFAPAHNLRTIAVEIKDRPFWHRILFYFDIPILLGHSFIFYRMCYSISPEISEPLNYHYFYWLFFLLLAVNVVWLFFIECRLRCFMKEGCYKFKVWIVNNLVHCLIFGLLWLTYKFVWFPLNDYLYMSPYIILFIIAFSNCIIDFGFSAHCYLGFEKDS